MNFRNILNLLFGRPVNFIDPSARIGVGTKIWHWAVILSDVQIGENCNIGSGVEIGRGTLIGDNTRISSGVFLPPNSVIGSNVFIGPRCVFTDDKFPMANNPHYLAEPPLLRDGCAIGAGAVILPSVMIGEGARVGAGAIVTRNVPPKTMVRGEPARERAYQSLTPLRQLNHEHTFYGG